MKKEGEVCVWRLQPSTKAINDFEDKPLLLSVTMLCIFFTSSIILPISSFLYFVIHFLSYQKNALRAQWYFCSLSLASPFISFDSVPSLIMLLLDIVTDETPKSESLTLSFRLWVVSRRRLPCQRHYNTKKSLPFNMSWLVTFVPLNMALQIHQQLYLMRLWFRMTEFLRAGFHRIVFGRIRMIWALTRLSAVMRAAECYRLLLKLHSVDLIHWCINVWPAQIAYNWYNKMTY